MDDASMLERIVINPRVLVGQPHIRDTRLSVSYVLGLLAHGTTVEGILEEYEGLTREDIMACLQYC